jgi:hypothetical protein
MRVVTIESFGNWTPNSAEHRGFVYKGDAYLFRFIIQSPDHFLRDELPNLLRQLGVSIASVYRLVLTGRPGTGLYEVRLYVSFEEPPDEEKFELLRMEVQPSEPPDHPNDSMQWLFYELLRNARPSTKKNLARALELEEQDAKTAH